MVLVFNFWLFFLVKNNHHPQSPPHLGYRRHISQEASRQSLHRVSSGSQLKEPEKKTCLLMMSKDKQWLIQTTRLSK